MKLTKAEKALFSRMGKIGGKLRAAKLSPERRIQIARQAARSRWDAVRLEREKGLAS